MSEERILIVTADELGRSPGINRGIAEAHEAGIVTSASAMVRRSAAHEAAELARAHPDLSVGLHVDLCEWVCRDGRWSQVESVVPLDDEDAVAEEVFSQLAEFRTLFGGDPTHLNSHQNVHRSGPLRSILLEVARDLDVPLRHFESGISTCSEFYGQTSRGLPFPDGVTVERLVSILDTLPPGRTELVCHPGRGRDAASGYEAEREMEVEVLTDPSLTPALERRGIRLRSFREAWASRPSPPPGLEASFRERGQAAYERRDFERAELWFRRAVAAGGDRPWSWLWLARAQLRAGDPRASRASIEHALELDPECAPALLHLADLELEAGREGEAAAILASLAPADEDGANGDASRGARDVARRVYRFADPREALRVAEALVRRHPEEEAAVAAEATALWRSGARERARGSLVSLARTRPLRGIRAGAEFRLEIGDAPSAWRLLRSTALGERDRRLVVRVAQALRRRGDLLLAWEAFDRAVGLGAADPGTRYWRDVVLGEVHVLSGTAAPSLPAEGPYEAVPGRVLHVVGKSLPWAQSGYAVRTRYVTLAQAEHGLDPHVATQLAFPWEEGVRDAPLWEAVDGVPHHRIPAPGRPPARLDDRLRLNALELARLVRRVRPAALHAASDYRNALLALAAGRAFGLPVVYEVRGFWEETWRSKQSGTNLEESPAYRWRRDRELECMERADRVVTLAEVMKAELVARGIPEGKVTVVPNAVDPAAFQPQGPDPELARSLGFAEGDVVLGYVSSFVAYEGIEHLIEAVAKLVARGHPVRGLLVGDGEERTRLEERAGALGIADRVRFTGRVPHEDVGRYYALIDLFVVPRRGDRVCRMVTPLKPYEAMAMERVVVVSGVEALQEMVVPGITGLVFRPEDPDDLAAVVEPLLRSPERRSALGRQARVWVSTHRTWTGNGERYRDLFRSLGVAGAEGGRGREPEGRSGGQALPRRIAR